VFRAADAPVAPAKPQSTPATLVDMPKRERPQPVLGSAESAATLTPPVAVPLPGGERRRQRRRPGETPTEEPKRKRKEKKERRPRSGKRIAKRTGLIMSLVLVVVAGFLAFKFYRDIAKLTGNNNPFSLLGAFHPVELKNQNGRVNILVAANSADDVGHGGANLTDSIMVLSVDTKHNTALMLSIPRDLWVMKPDGSHGKINSIFPDDGMDGLRDVVQDTLGFTIDYDALVNYGAFHDLVDAVGGITITINSDDPRGIYDPSLDWTSKHCCALAKYPNGPVILDGKQALNLARARGDAYGSYGYAQSDFTRTMYQRKMLMAIKDKASQKSVIANPFKVAAIVDAVGNNVKTDLQVAEIETLYTYMKKINDNDIASYNINTLKSQTTTMLQNYTTPDGQSALIPAAGVDDYTAIQTQLKKVLSADKVAREAAMVVVLNATDTTGLALRQAGKLEKKGMDVMTADAPANQATSTLIDNSGGDMPNTLAYLKKTYGATVVTNKSLTAGYPGADFILIVGQSAVPTPATTGQ